MKKCGVLNREKALCETLTDPFAPVPPYVWNAHGTLKNFKDFGLVYKLRVLVLNMGRKEEGVAFISSAR